MAQVRVVRKGVTPTEVVTVLGRRLGGGFEVVAEKHVPCGRQRAA
jgi:hypothetical protein